MRKHIPASVFGAGHTDYDTISLVEREILKVSGGNEKLKAFYAGMLRDEIDKLIDTPNTDRRNYNELEKVEKTYIGTRVEIRLRKFWGYPKGILDLRIRHIDVDIKHTMESGWMIPSEAVEQVCILSAADENTARCYLGLILVRPAYLTKSKNKDQKFQIKTAEWKNIRWLIFETPYPPNFWKTLDLKTVDDIFAPPGGTERIVRLFEKVMDRPIARKNIIDTAQQLDSLKRIRKNGGARDKLLAGGILLLSGKYDRAVITALGLPNCSDGEFISHRVSGKAERAIAAQYGFNLHG